MACILRNTILSPSTSTIRNQGVYILRPLDGSLLASRLNIRINVAYLLRYTILSTSTLIRPLDGSLYFCLKIKISAAYFLRHTILSSSTCIIRNRVLTSFVPWTEACITVRLKMRISAAYFLHHTILPQALLLFETGYLHPSSPGRKLVS